MYKYISSLILLSFSYALSCFAQPLGHIKHYSINDGLAQGVIMSYVQDSKGYMWFATWNGLNKFDGYTFETFKARSGDDSVIENNRIEFMRNGIYDWIWCRTYDSRAYVFKPETRTFTNVLDSIPLEEARVQRLNVLTKGVVWYICDDGFCYRFDEKRYKHSPHFDGYSSTRHHNLKGSSVYNILQDHDGDEWILTDKGATIVGKKKIDSPLPFRYFEEVNNQIWLATREGQLARYNQQSGEVKIIPLPVQDARITVLSTVDSRTLAIGTFHHGLILFNTTNESCKVIDIRTPQQSSNEVQSLYLDKYKILWMSTASAGVMQWDCKKQALTYLSPLPAIHTDDKYEDAYLIFEDINDRLWIRPKGGSFNYYDRQMNKLLYFHNGPHDPNSSLASPVHSCFSDKQGNLWINTTDRELDKVNFFPTPLKMTNLNAETRSLFKDSKQRIWIGTKDKKIRIYNDKSELAGFLSPDGRIIKEEVMFGVNVYCFMEMGDEIWLGTLEEGLYILRKDSKYTDRYHVRHYEHNSSDSFSLSHNRVYTIYQDRQKRIWIGTFGGGLNLVHYTPEKEIRFLHAGNQLKNYPEHDYSRVRCVSETANGTLLVGTTKGLISFSSHFNYPQDIRFYTHTRRPNDRESLGNNNVIHIYNTKGKETYISTLGGGLNKVVFKKESPEGICFQSYDQQSGLASDWIISSVEDQENNLWIVSQKMISKLNGKTQAIENYRWDFLETNMFYSEAPAIIGANNQLLLGTNKGFISLPIESIRKSEFVPPIVLTSFRIFNEQHPVLHEHLSEISLTPTQRNITIEFAALDYADPENINYAYKLEGLDTDWNYTGKKRSVSYINLPRGKHNLLIKSTNSDGTWVDNTYTLTIHVLPKFVETIWFLILMVALFMVLTGVILYILFYIYRLRHRLDVEKQITDIKLRFFTNISHEFRTPLTLITGPVSELLNEDLPDKTKEYLGVVKKNTDHLLRLVSQILDFRKIQNRKMKLLVEEVDIIQSVSTMMEHFYLMAKDKNIDFRLVTDTDNQYMWIDTDKIEKTIFNLLSNAFKYTPAGKSIVIKIETGQPHVCISIIDEGRGISPNQIETIFQRFETIVNRNIMEPSSGIGLSLARELVEMHHGKITVTSERGVGSCFCVTLPKGKEHFREGEQVEFILSDSLPVEDLSLVSLQESEPSAGETDEHKISILLVEDNESLRNFLQSVLSANYMVLTAGNGQEGYEKALDHLPELIVSDVMMPVMDGLDMVKEIKRNKDICHIPIVLLSAKSSLDDRITGLEYGIDDYITKPFSTTYLKARIASLIHTRRQLQESYRKSLFDGNPGSKPDISPMEPQVKPYDQQFIEQLLAFMEENMGNSELAVEDIGKSLAMGRTLFYNKVKSILGISPIEFVNQVRIKRAIQLMEKGERNISQIADLTGFDDPKYFSRCFKKQVGMTPVQYRDQVTSAENDSGSF